MRKPLLSLERNNRGQAFVGITEFGTNDMAVRSGVLIGSDPMLHDALMVKRFRDLERLTDNNAVCVIDAGFFPYDITPLRNEACR